MADETPTPEPQPEPTPEPQAVAPAEPQYATRDDFARLERTLAALASNLPQAQPTPQTSKDLSDEELWGLAQQGNRQAFELYQERIADRKIQQRLRGSQKEASVQAQLGALVQGYPELAQNGHVINTRYQQWYAALKGIDPSTPELQLQLDAALRAVSSSRDVLQSKPVQPARTPMSGQMGASHREPERTPQQPAVTADEASLARKMGVKDPSKATTKFWERNKNGLNSVSPNVAAALQMGGQG